MNPLFFLRRAGWLLPLLAVLACKKSSDLEPALVGEADMRRYVAVGDAYTAGVSNGGLYRAGQLASYPNLLAQQFALSGGRGDFVQPLFSEVQENGSGYLRLTAVSPLTFAPVTEKLAVRGTNPTLYTKFEGDNQNLGVPNLRLTNVNAPGYGTPSGNPYFERLLPGGQEQKTYAQYVSDSKPTFFTYWLGNDDLLAFVSSGGTRPLPETGTFAANTKQLLDALAATGAKGAVANLPDPTGFPVADATHRAGGLPPGPLHAVLDHDRRRRRAPRHRRRPHSDEHRLDRFSEPRRFSEGLFQSGPT